MIYYLVKEVAILAETTIKNLTDHIAA